MTKPSLYSVNEHLVAYNVKSLRIKLKFTWHLSFMGSPTSARYINTHTHTYTKIRSVHVSRIMVIPHQRLNQCLVFDIYCMSKLENWKKKKSKTVFVVTESLGSYEINYCLDNAKGFNWLVGNEQLDERLHKIKSSLKSRWCNYIDDNHDVNLNKLNWFPSLLTPVLCVI